MAKLKEEVKETVKEETKEYKPGAYVCIVDGDGFAFFNKRKYKYGDRVVVEEESLVKQLMGAGPRFIPESEFEKIDADVVRKIRSASSNNKTVEDVVRSAEAEKKQMKKEYEAQLEELRQKLQRQQEEKELQ